MWKARTQVQIFLLGSDGGPIDSYIAWTEILCRLPDRSLVAPQNLGHNPIGQSMNSLYIRDVSSLNDWLGHSPSAEFPALGRLSIRFQRASFLLGKFSKVKSPASTCSLLSIPWDLPISTLLEQYIDHQFFHPSTLMKPLDLRLDYQLLKRVFLLNQSKAIH
jgi:hypothetical protein